MDLSNLNPAQLEAVLHNTGPCRTLAGAGSGKTRVLTTRIGRLVIDEDVPARNIVAVTFTRKAAGEMAERIEPLIGAEVEDLNVGTFHSICYQILKDEWRRTKSKGYEPASEWWQRRAIGNIIYDEMNWSHDVGAALSWISWQKNNIRGPEDELLRVPPQGPLADKYRTMYRLYEERKEQEKKLDFDDMLLQCYWLLMNKPPVRARYSSQFKYILVDEFQDTCLVQYEILKMWARPYNNVFVVGDARQCQPAGTMVLTPHGLRDIANLKDGDEVYSWDRNVQRMTKVPRKISAGKRHYEGNLLLIKANGKTTRCTPNHKFLVRWTEKPKDLWVCYLMYRSDRGFRVGWCQLFDYKGNFHLGTRARLEKAEKVWILSYHTDKADVSAQESIINIRYGIPTAIFEPDSKHTPLYNDKVIEKVFAEANPVNGYICLAEHRLNFDLPIYPYPGKHTRDHAGRPTIFTVYAANLSIWMSVPMPEQQVWEPVKEVTHEVFKGIVYSLDVEDTHNYIAGGIVTLNSIYGWRAAQVNYILDFEKEWPGARTVILDTNYRSSTNIVELSNRLIRGAGIAYPGECQAHRGSMEEPCLLLSDHEDHEAEQVVGEVLAMIENEDYGRGDCAILFRTNAQARALEDALISAEVPYVIYGGTGFYARKEVRDILAYLRILEDPKDEESIRRIINVPTRYLGKVFMDRAREYASREGISILKAVRKCPEAEQHRYRGVKDFLHCIDHLKRDKPYLSPAQMVQLVRTVTRYDDWLAKEDGIEDEADNHRTENLNALVKAAQRFSSLKDFLFYTEQASSKPADSGDVSDKVQLMTLHRSKGLEFPVVFLAGMNQGLLPHKRSIEYGLDGKPTPESVEEERRLAYVGMTRAMDILYLSATKAYQDKPMEPSMFLKEVWKPKARESGVVA